MDKPCVYKKVNRTKVVFLTLYIDDILLNRKWHFFTLVSKDLIVQEFFHERYERSNLYIGNKDL
jgi:hypothetical protein